jgi:hypothetical protein
MKLALQAGALALALTFASSVSRADDGCCPGCAGAEDAAPASGPVVQVDDPKAAPGDDDAAMKELESRLNEVLVVEENGRIVLKQEFAQALPFPPERVQAMLGSFVEVGPDGKLKLRNPEMIKPYLPMIKRFLSPESMERLRGIQNLPEDQRREALRQMFGQSQPQQEEGPPAPAPRARPEPHAAPGASPAPDRPRHEARDEDGDEDEDEGGMDERMTRLEHRLDRLERALRDSTERRHSARDEGDREDPLARLRGLFGRGGDEQGRPRMSLAELGHRMEVWRAGLSKLVKLMQPDDLQRLGRALDKLRGQVGPDDLRDRGKLLEKLQDSVDPADVGRFMEIFSEFIATPEGRALADEVEAMVDRLEGVVNSDQGKRLGDALGRLGQGDLRDRMERLMRGRDRDQGDQGDEGARRPRQERGAGHRQGGGRPRNIPDGARLY